MKKYIYIFIGSLFISSCGFEFEKEIDFNQGNTQNKLVVEGVIQAGYPAYVILTNSEPYFSPVGASTLENLFVKDAQVTITNQNGQTVELINIHDIPDFGIDSLDQIIDSIAAAIPGFYIEWPINLLEQAPYSSAIGKFGEQFELNVYHYDDTISAITTIPNEHPMDSLWFLMDETAPRQNLGNIWFHYNDPDTLGNTIMIEHKRLAHTKESLNPPGSLNTYNVKDTADSFFSKALWGFVRNDFEGLNGTSFDTFFQRGTRSTLINGGDGSLTFEGEERGYFKAGQSIPEHNRTVNPDVVLVRLSQIDYESYLFWRSLEYQAQSTGNPFAEPINLQSNVNNGFGGFIGQAATYYKIVCKEDTTYTQKYFPLLFEIL
jgi:hypothetical protein